MPPNEPAPTAPFTDEDRARLREYASGIDCLTDDWVPMEKDGEQIPVCLRCVDGLAWTRAEGRDAG